MGSSRGGRDGWSGDGCGWEGGDGRGDVCCLVCVRLEPTRAILGPTLIMCLDSEDPTRAHANATQRASNLLGKIQKLDLYEEAE